MSRLTRDGATEPVSRDQILRRERGQGKTTSKIAGILTRLILNLYYYILFYFCIILVKFTILLTFTFYQSSRAWASARTFFTSDIAIRSNKEVLRREYIACSPPSMYIQVPRVLLSLFWCTCMAINVSVRRNGRLLLDILHLTLSMLLQSGNPI